MARNLAIFLAILCFSLLGLAAADWNILKQKRGDGLEITLKNYCESWRMNVELHNILDFDVVPNECVSYIGKYMTSTQYKVDSERTIQEAIVYLSTRCNLKKDGADAWVFDIDDTLLSSVPYYKKNGFGGNKLNVTSLEEWMSQGKAPALEHSLKLFNELKEQGVQIILVSSRMESLRSATVDNLVNEGFFGWTSLILRGLDDACKDIQTFKADVRKKLISKGYRIWGILGDQWSSIDGLPAAKRTFKLPNPIQICSSIDLWPSDVEDLLPSLEDMNPKQLEKMVSILKECEDLDCPNYMFPPMNPVITFCAHIFCKGCIRKSIRTTATNCPVCRHPLSDSDIFTIPPRIFQKDNTIINCSSSTKVSVFLKCLYETREQSPATKSVIFSQFQKILLILEKSLKALGFKVLKLDGSMTAKKRVKKLKS